MGRRAFVGVVGLALLVLGGLVVAAVRPGERDVLDPIEAHVVAREVHFVHQPPGPASRIRTLTLKGIELAEAVRRLRLSTPARDGWEWHPKTGYAKHGKLTMAMQLDHRGTVIERWILIRLPEADGRLEVTSFEPLGALEVTLVRMQHLGRDPFAEP